MIHARMNATTIHAKANESCTFTSAQDAASASGCSVVTLTDIVAPGGQTLELKNLKPGAQVCLISQRLYIRSGYNQYYRMLMVLLLTVDK